ncbi:MAG: hypothetical protein M3N39_01150 [Pseudomonadota bacterium]|nr:hypothetical protein [Pseudomonadota bacterium]
MSDRRIGLAGALLAATGIGCGAFGVHVLRNALGRVRLMIAAWLLIAWRGFSRA